MFDDGQTKVEIPYVLSLQTVFEDQISFHDVTLMGSEATCRKLNTSGNLANSILAWIPFEFVQNAWDALRKSCSLALPLVEIQPYVWFKTVGIQIQVFFQHSDDFLSLRKLQTFLRVGPLHRDLKQRTKPRKKRITRSRWSDQSSFVLEFESLSDVDLKN